MNNNINNIDRELKIICNIIAFGLISAFAASAAVLSCSSLFKI